jgi:hypothetical protein
MAISTLSALGMAWAAATVVLVALMIYRGLLSMKEDDQLFLDAAEEHLEKEQLQLQARIDQMSKYAMILGAVSVALLLVMAGVWTYQQFTQPPIS